MPIYPLDRDIKTNFKFLEMCFLTCKVLTKLSIKFPKTNEHLLFNSLNLLTR